MTDFSTYDAYLDSNGLIAYEDEGVKPQTQTLPLRAPRTEFLVPTNFESHPEFGDLFSQGDFSGGAGQEHYHRPRRDERKFYSSEGFDISEPGRLKLLHATAEADSQASVGSIEITGGVPFFIAGTTLRKGNGSFPGTWSNEDPHAGEGSQTVHDLASSGDELYAAIATNGIHKRNAAGTWSHYVAEGSSAITRLAWAKDRLIAADGRNIYEITTSGALPSALETLPEGWVFEDIFEVGGFIYACAVSTDAGLSRVHHYGLTQDASALEKKGSTEVPRGQLVYTGKGYLGSAYLGGGVENDSGGLNPVVYQAFPSANGFLDLIKLVEEEGAGASDLAVRAIEPIGESVVFSWSLGSGAPTGARTGLAIHDLGRDALAHHLKGPAGTARVDSIRYYKGRLLFTVDGDGLFYEDVGTYVASAELVTSMADWNNAGQKIFDTFDVSHSALAAGEVVKLRYATKHPDEATFTDAVTSDTDGAEGKSTTLITNVKGRKLTVKLVVTVTDQSATPEVYAFSVRSNPAPTTLEYVLQRAFRILERDQKDDHAETVYNDVETLRDAIHACAQTWKTFEEPGKTWNAYVLSVSDITPMTEVHRTTSGETQRKGYVLQVQMIAREQ